jgi:RNA polymerase sigma-70 factor (family 1)
LERIFAILLLNLLFHLSIGHQHTERELLVLVEQGDPDAFRRLFIAHRPRLYTAAMKILDNPELAEDICQDTFLQVWLKRHTLTGIDNFPGWLFIIARNKMYDAIKKLGKQKTGNLDFLTDMAAHPDDDDHGLHTKELQEILHTAIARLPERQRQAYLLIKQEGLSREEAAQRMNVAPETIKSHLEHAMRNIRAYCLTRLDRSMVLVLLTLFH